MLINPGRRLLWQGPVELIDERGLRRLGLGDPLQAEATARAQLEPDFHQHDAPKLVEQLPRGEAGRGGAQFVFEAD